MSRARGGVFAIVPVKAFERSKSRLAPVLGADERMRLAQRMFEHVAGVIEACPGIDALLVATDSPEVAAMALARGAHARSDEGPASLGAIVDAALADVAARGASAAIVVMSDLPQLEASEIGHLVALLAEHDVALAPDRADRGTNAIAIAAPGARPTAFGHADSFDRHLAAAASAGLRLAVHRSAGLALDIDTPEDMAWWRGSEARQHLA